MVPSLHHVDVRFFRQLLSILLSLTHLTLTWVGSDGSLLLPRGLGFGDSRTLLPRGLAQGLALGDSRTLLPRGLVHGLALGETLTCVCRKHIENVWVVSSNVTPASAHD